MKLFTISLLTLLFFSCTITKRRVLPGYHINWGKHELSQKKEEVKEIENQQHDSYFLKLENQIENQKSTISTSTCDTIRLQDGSVILGKIISLDSKIVEYKSCENESSFIHKIYKTTIKSISYSNGVVYEHKSETEIKEKRKQLEEKHKKTESQISKIDKESQKDKPIEKNGQNSIFLFFVTILCLIILILININLTLPLFIFLLIALFTSNIASLFLAIKSLKIMSKNPELYRSKGLILFFTFLESLILLIFSFAAIYVLLGYLYFGV